MKYILVFIIKYILFMITIKYSIYNYYEIYPSIYYKIYSMYNYY